MTILQLTLAFFGTVSGAQFRPSWASVGNWVSWYTKTIRHFLLLWFQEWRVVLMCVERKLIRLSIWMFNNTFDTHIYTSAT